MASNKHSPINPQGEPLLRAFILNEVERLNPKDYFALIDRVVKLSYQVLDNGGQTPEANKRQQALAQLAQALMIDCMARGDFWGRLV